MISFTDSFCAIQNSATTKLRLTFSPRRKIRLYANWLVWEERLWGVEGGSLWSNSRQFIGFTANTRAGEKVFKFLRLKFINYKLVRVTRVNISCLKKMAKLVTWTWTWWTNQQTNAHQKRPYKPRKLIGQGVWQCNGRSVSQKGPRKGPAHQVRVTTRSTLLLLPCTLYHHYISTKLFP